MYRRTGTLVVGVVLALVFASPASAAFDALGSTEQVDITGLPATDDPGDAQVSLLDSSDNVVQTRNANFLGGALFRNVAPGDYTVASGDLTDGDGDAGPDQGGHVGGTV
jgi:hypothetical protein